MAPQHLGGDTQRKIHTHADEGSPRCETFRMVHNLTVKKTRFFIIMIIFKSTLGLYVASSDNTQVIKRSQ